MQYISLANFAMLAYLTSKQSSHFELLLAGGFGLVVVLIVFDWKYIVSDEADFYYNKSRRWTALEAKVNAIHAKVVENGVETN
jgi:hypothetical protein